MSTLATQKFELVASITDFYNSRKSLIPNELADSLITDGNQSIEDHYLCLFSRPSISIGLTLEATLKKNMVFKIVQPVISSDTLKEIDTIGYMSGFYIRYKHNDASLQITRVAFYHSFFNKILIRLELAEKIATTNSPGYNIEFVDVEFEYPLQADSQYDKNPSYFKIVDQVVCQSKRDPIELFDIKLIEKYSYPHA